MFFHKAYKQNKKKIFFSITVIVLFTISFQLNTKALKATNIEKNWIRDSGFELSEDHWYTSLEGDISDVNASLYSEQGNFEISGEKRNYTLTADPPLSLDWFETDNPNFPNRPDLDEITDDGCRVSHAFDDITAVQNPSVHWDHNITLPVNMTDYVIKSASVQAIVNATVDRNLDRLEDYLTGDLARLNPNYVVDTYSVGDYIRFYILVSDLKKAKVYEIAHFQTEQIGSLNPPGKEYLYDTYMLSVPQDVLIFYLESVLDTDHSNFTISLGIRIHIEDNLANYWDLDNFDELYIKFVNLSFTYEKKIDRYTSVSFNQIGDSINETNVEITNTILSFRYKISESWSEMLSPNSELKIFINDYEIMRTIKLGDMNTTYGTLTLGSIDIKSRILKDVNISLSLMLFIADNFELDHKIIVSIDDVYLTISYIIYTEDYSQIIITWIVLCILFIVIAVLASLMLKTYFFIPRKLRKRDILLSRTQKFKDAENIQGILLIHNKSGLPIFSKNYSELMEGKDTLFSGFIQAVSLVGEEMSIKKSYPSKGIRKDLIDGVHNVIELDFKHFYCLISDIEELRTVLILNNKASKRLKRQMLSFGLSVYAKFSDTLKNWDNDKKIFKNEIPILLNNYFNLQYKEFYELVIENSDVERVKKEYKLTRNEFKILNEIYQISKEEKNFRLMNLLEKLSYRNEDMVIDVLQILMKYNLIIPSSSLEF
ncbi:MAG: hypothetical protein ACFFE4_08220 [Candidatus Thorarchaeota archaeon]